VNVEYNQLEPLLKASGLYPEGDVNDPAINQLIFSIPEYAAVLKRTGGLVPEFVNPKYADATKTKFKKPTRLECMMQDHPKVLGPESKVGFTTFPEWTYSPVKNSVDEARAKIAVGAPGRTAAEGELEYYSSAVSQLASIGVPKPTGAEGSLNVFGFSLKEPAHVVLYPSFAPTYSLLKKHFPSPENVKISSRSTVVIEGGNITIESLDVDGAVTIRNTGGDGSKVIIKSLKVNNAGVKLQPLTEEEQNKSTPAGAAIPDSIRIRGFKVVKGEEKVVEFSVAGEHVVSE
jgi:UDP-sugar pyrophosphorylase